MLQATTSQPRPRISRRRRQAVVAALVTLTLTSTTLVEVAGATPASVSVTNPNVTTDDDWFTNSFGDPMDFSNAADFDTAQGYRYIGGAASMQNGQLQIVGSGQIFLLRTDNGSWPTSAARDPRSRPLDAGYYSRVSFRMHSSQAVAGALGFRTCFEPGCADGHKYFNIQAGWHTYNLDMVGGADLDGHPGGTPFVDGTPWSNYIQYLYMSPAFNVPNKPTLTFDDVRIIHPTDPIQLNLAGGTGSQTLWSQVPGQDPNNLGPVTTNGTIAVPSGILRRGESARFWTSDGSTNSAQSGTVTMGATSRPAPRILSPSETGGTDWAQEAFNDPWDFNEGSDISAATNTNFSTSGGEGHGSTAGPTVNDPSITLNTRGRVIDATLYHKAVFTIRYDGGFSLADVAGGGMNARLMWHVYGTNGLQISDDLVVQPQKSTYVVDLRTSPPAAILDPAGNPNPIGWGAGAGTWIDAFRLDPHEDRGNRGWHIDDMKLLRNEAATPNFNIRWIDDSWSPGTTADLVADNDSNPFNGQYVIATGVGTTAGENSYNWNSSGVPKGTYSIRLALRNAAGAGTTVTSQGQVDVDQQWSGPPPGTPGAAAPFDAAAFARFVALVRWIQFVNFVKAVCAPRRVRVGGRYQLTYPCGK